MRAAVFLGPRRIEVQPRWHRRGVRCHGRAPRDQVAGDGGGEGDTPMTEWTGDELTKIGSAEEMQIASLRGDGTLRKPVTIWVVRDGDDLYVRSVNGRTSSWFRGVRVRHEGRIRAGGVDKDVLLVETDDMNDEIDAAYRSKYCRYAESIVDSIIS